MPEIATDLLDPPAFPNHPPGRITHSSALVRSIEGMGMLEPILVTAEGNRFRIVDGLRRLEAALLLGLAKVPIHVADNLPGPHALAAGVAVNTQREPMPPTQQWRALAALEEQGMRLDAAAAYLGMDPRHACRLAKLGQLHPDLLTAIAAIEADPDGEFDMPDQRELALIAAAPPDVQLEHFNRLRQDNGFVPWDDIADRCKVRRISAKHAIFDRQTADVLFDEDLFAEPGSPDQFTTSDIDGFLAAQRLALAAQVDTLKPKSRWHVTEDDGPRAAHAAGQQPTITHDTRPRLATGEHCWGYVEAGGWNIGRVRWTVAVPKAGTKPAPDNAADRDPHDDEADANLPDADDPDTDSPDDPLADTARPAADVRPLTKDGQTLVAKAKTQALGDALRNRAELPSFRHLTAHLILAFHARNVTVKSRPHLHDDQLAVFRALIDPAGHLTLPDDATLANLAAGTLATVLSIDDPAIANGHYYDMGSGPVAEWIGHAINAGEHLPRLDTAELLATANGDTLRDAAIAALINPKGTVADLRRRLEGHAEAWHPPGTEFGAPGPKPLPANRRRPATEMEDAA